MRRCLIIIIIIIICLIVGLALKAGGVKIVM